MEVYTIGFTKKSAGEFFGALKRAGIRRLLDIRLNNSSQLAGFSKRDDLAYFLKEICGAEYVHKPLWAPTQEILDGYKKKKGSWEDFERKFLGLMAERRVEDKIDGELLTVPTVLLCSEPTAERCHRRLLLDYMKAKGAEFEIVHL